MAEPTTDLADRIEEVAAGPAAASGDAGSVTQQRIPDLISADIYLRRKDAGAKKTSGLRFVKLIPPGAD